MGREQPRQGKHFCVLIAFAAVSLIATGCAPLWQTGRCPEYPTTSDVRQGEASLQEGHYDKALKFYRRALDKSPDVSDRALFYIGVIYASPKYDDANYQKALDMFHRLLKEYPESRYCQESERMAMLLREIISREKKGQTLKTQCDSLKAQVDGLETQIKQMKAVDMDIEGKRRRIEVGK